MSISQVNCREFFKKKVVLITGCTGFVGKVLLEKILRTLNIQKVYVMIRSKGKEQPQQRFIRTIISSRCFDRLRRQEGENFTKFINHYVEAIEGDFCQDRLGMTQEARLKIINSVNVILNAAACVQFDLPLKRAIEINFYGNLKMMQLAIECKNLEIFLHFSTVYVNGNQNGIVKEIIYNEQPDILSFAQSVYNRAETITDKEVQILLKGLPNTYSFAKHMAEQMFKQLKPTQMSLSIIRPSIIGCALREPEVGWIDSFASSAAVLMNSGNGMLKVFKCNPNMQSCHIPVDMLVDQVIAISAFEANRQQFKIFNSGCSERNPNYLFWRILDTQVKDFWTEHKAKKRISEPKVITTNNKLYLKLIQIRCRMMAKLGLKIAQEIGSDESIKQSQIDLKNIERGVYIGNVFSFFAENEWVFSQSNMNQIVNNLSDQDKEFLSIDVATVDWNQFFQIYNYGIQKFLLGENIEIPSQTGKNNFNIDKMQEQRSIRAKL